MKKCQIATQCYTLRDFMHTPGGVDRSFAKLREIGFEAVQISGVPTAPAEVKKYADLNGMIICATHEGGDSILGNIDAVILFIVGTLTADSYRASACFINLSDFCGVINN